MKNEPAGWTPGDRELAPHSPYHDESDPPRQLLTVTLTIAVSVPAGYRKEDLAEQLAWTLYSDPYVRKVEGEGYEYGK